MSCSRWPALIALLLAAPASAGELRLREAFEEAAQRNLRIRIARSDERSAKAGVEVQEGRFALRLSSQLEALERTVDREGFGGQLRYELGLAKRFSTGTDLIFRGVGSQAFGRPDKIRSLINPPWQTDVFYYNDPSYAGVELGLEQSLLRGAGFAPNEAPVNAAVEVLKSARVGLEEELARQLRDVEIEYWGWAAAVRAVEIREASLGLARVQQKRTAQLIKSGRQARSDALLAEQIVADRRDALVVAEAEAATRMERLFDLMGFAVTEMPATAPSPEDFPTAVGEVEPAAAVTGKTKNANYLIRRLRHQQTAVEYELLATEDASWPELNAGMHLQLFGTDGNLGSAYGDAFGFGNHVFIGSLRFSYPLGYNPAEADAERLQHELVKQRTGIEDATRKAQLQAVAARREVVLAQSRIELATLAKRLATDKLRAEEERYAIGRTTMQDLRQFQEDLDEASLRLVQAHVSYLSAQAQLDFLLGRFLKQRSLGPSST